jgi:hypothetical protein
MDIELMLDVCWGFANGECTPGTISPTDGVHEARLHLAVLMRALMHLDPRRLAQWIRQLPHGHPRIWESPREWNVYFLVRSPHAQDVFAGYKLIYNDLVEANPSFVHAFERVFVGASDGCCTTVDLYKCGLRRIPDTFGMINIKGGCMSGSVHLQDNLISTLPRSSNMYVSGNLYMNSNLIDSLPCDFANLRIGGKLFMYDNPITLHSRMQGHYDQPYDHTIVRSRLEC